MQTIPTLSKVADRVWSDGVCVYFMTDNYGHHSRSPRLTFVGLLDFEACRGKLEPREEPDVEPEKLNQLCAENPAFAVEWQDHVEKCFAFAKMWLDYYNS